MMLLLCHYPPSKPCKFEIKLFEDSTNCVNLSFKAFVTCVVDRPDAPVLEKWTRPHSVCSFGVCAGDISHQRGEGSLHARMIVLPDTEDRTIVSSFVWTKYRNVTDRRTNRQICRGCCSGLHCEQCGRAVKI